MGGVEDIRIMSQFSDLLLCTFDYSWIWLKLPLDIAECSWGIKAQSALETSNPVDCVLALFTIGPKTWRLGLYLLVIP